MDACNVKPLPTDLKINLEKGISIYQGSKNIVRNTELISAQTGSRSFVYRVTCKGLKGNFQLVAKVQNTKGARLEGLIYEKMVYSLMTKIVDSGVCPFRLRSYDIINQPKHVLITETFDNMIDLSEFLKAFQNNKYHESDCYNLLIQILYAIEVNYRVGIRHNDLHVHNVMILFCDTKPGHKKLTYLSRNKNKKSSLLMHNCRFIVKFFDNDRATKLAAKNDNINGTYHSNYDPKPVLDLFPWHQPAVYTEKLDMFKIMQHIRDDTKSIFLKNLLESLNVSLSESEKYEISRIHGQNNFLTYHLVTGKSKRLEPLAARCSRTKSSDACTTKNIRISSTFPKWLDKMNSSEKALMILAESIKRVKGKKYTEVGDISKLYVKRHL